MRRKLVALAAVAALSVLAAASLATSRAGASSQSATQQVPISGTGSPQTGDFTPSADGVAPDEFPTGDNDEGPDPYNGTISLSSGAGGGPTVSGGKKAKSNPTFENGFEGLNHYQQRYSR